MEMDKTWVERKDKARILLVQEFSHIFSDENGIKKTAKLFKIKHTTLKRYLSKFLLTRKYQHTKRFMLLPDMGETSLTLEGKEKLEKVPDRYRAFVLLKSNGYTPVEIG